VPLFGGGCLRALGMWSLILAQAFAYGNFRGMLDPTLPLTYRDHGVENPSELRLDPPFSKRKNNLWPLESRGPIGNFSEIASKLSFRAPRKLGINARLSTPFGLPPSLFTVASLKSFHLHLYLQHPSSSIQRRERTSTARKVLRAPIRNGWNC
jgi:hypothetical protein